MKKDDAGALQAGGERRRDSDNPDQAKEAREQRPDGGVLPPAHALLLIAASWHLPRASFARTAVSMAVTASLAAASRAAYRARA